MLVTWILNLATADPEGLSEAAKAGEGLNLLESNLINIVLLLALLVYLGRTVVAKVLADRRQAIAQEIAAAEAKRDQARQALAEQQRNLAAAEAQAAEIIAQAEATAAKVKAEILAEVEAEIERLRSGADREMASQSDRVLQELRQALVAQVLRQVEADLPTVLTPERQQHLIERSLMALGRN
ncbi:MAG: F0F1 ATP synthase subunit B [Thermostichales cyanobacterium BF4_bins_65]